MPRSATAAGSLRDSDRMLNFAPTYKSPTLSPVQYWFTFGYRSMKLPNAGSVPKIGRLS
jgi:hypothetical protein